jgi:hypothetical protein
MHIAITWHNFFILLALILAILNAIPVRMPQRFGWWPWSWVCFLLAVFFV